MYPGAGTKQTSELMYPLVELWLSSDRTQRSICEEYQIKAHTFNYWRSKYQKEKRKKEKPASGFIPLEVNNEAEHSRSYFLEIEYKDGTVVRFTQPVDFRALRNLLPI